MRVITLFFMILSLFFGSSNGLAKSKKTIVRSVSKKEMLILRKVDKKYQKEHGIHLNLNKTITLAMLGSTKNSQGEIWLNKGKMRLEIHKPEASKIIADKEFLWIESAAPEGFKDVKTQVMKASLKSKQAKSQGLIQLLTQGGVLKYFRVSGVQKDGDKIIYFLQPDKQSVEFKRAQIVVDTKKVEILSLKYWDQMDNETNYEFTKSVFNKKLDEKVFSYTPPKDASVIVY